MDNTFARLKLIFLGLFAIGTVAVLVYHLFWVWPGQKCEEAGNWWDPYGRTCARPVLISDITGRTIDDIRAEKAAAAAGAKAAAAPAAPAAPAAAPPPPAR